MNSAWRLRECTESTHTPEQVLTPVGRLVEPHPPISTKTPKPSSSSATSPNKLLVLLKVKYNRDSSAHVLLNYFTRVNCAPALTRFLSLLYVLLAEYLNVWSISPLSP